MGDFIYILVLETQIDTDVMCFSSLELAKTKFEEFKNNYINTLQNRELYTIEDNSDDILPSFSAYPDGFYDDEHFIMTIYQREIDE